MSKVSYIEKSGSINKAKIYLLLLPVFLLINFAQAENQYFKFSIIQINPPDSACIDPLGLAGPYIEPDDGVLIVAGGANFPDKLPWDGGTKTYCDEIFILKTNTTGEYSWEKSTERIPFAAGYGGAIETPAGLLCFGGNTADECISESWYIDYNHLTDKVEINPGPSLPAPLTNFAFAQVDGNVYVAGGLSELSGASGKHFFRLTMAGSNPQFWTWEEIPPWEGEPRAFAVGVGQSNGETNCFYLFSGRNIQPGNDPEILYDAHVFNPYLNRW
ncbi:MAG: hypothetical protein ACOCVA_00315, partial [Prolixibacteraceae bacterium]